MLHKLVLASPDPELWHILFRSDPRQSSSGASEPEGESRQATGRGGRFEPPAALDAALL